MPYLKIEPEIFLSANDYDGPTVYHAYKDGMANAIRMYRYQLWHNELGWVEFDIRDVNDATIAASRPLDRNDHKDILTLVGRDLMNILEEGHLLCEGTG